MVMRMNNYRERARAAEMSRLLAKAVQLARDGIKHVFVPRRIAVPE